MKGEKDNRPTTPVERIKKLPWVELEKLQNFIDEFEKG